MLLSLCGKERKKSSPNRRGGLIISFSKNALLPMESHLYDVISKVDSMCRMRAATSSISPAE